MIKGKYLHPQGESPSMGVLALLGSWFVLRSEEFQAERIVSCTTCARDSDLEKAAEKGEKRPLRSLRRPVDPHWGFLVAASPRCALCVHGSRPQRSLTQPIQPG